jgi:phage head maturation protease
LALVGWFRTLLNWQNAPTPQSAAEASVTFSVDIPTPVDELISTRAWNDLGPVSRDLALSVPAMLRGRNLLCSIATLPLVTRNANREEQRTPLLEQIDPNVPNVVTMAQTVEDLVCEGISWWRVTERNAADWPVAAMHMDVGTVTLQPPSEEAWRKLRTLPSGQKLPGGVVWVNGEPAPGRDMIRFDSPNPPVLVAAARSLRRAILLERASATYADNPRPLDYFKPDEAADPVNDNEVEEILDKWAEMRRKRSTGYVPAALTYNTVDLPTPADLQLVELQRNARIDIANALGLDPEDLGVSTTSRTYQNATDRRRDRINDVLAPYMRAITDRLSMNDITRRGHRVEFDLDDYMKANAAERWTVYRSGLDAQVLSVPEVRELEGLPAVPVEPAPRRPQQTPPPRQIEQQQTEEAGMSRARPHARFSDQQETTRIAFEIPEADAAFKVDAGRRTVTGLLVPWNRIARSGFAKWRFAPNSLNWSQVERIKLNREHDRSQAVGYALRLESTDVGLVGTFKVARGAAGDEVLSLAEDKVLDGFSIEVDFDEDGSSWARDPDDELVRLVSNGRLSGTAITAAPAFDDARLSGVNATRNKSRKDSPMQKCATCQREHAPSVACTPDAPAAAPDTATVAAFTAAVEAFTAQSAEQSTAFQDALAQLVEVQAGGSAGGPATVDPTRPTGRFGVTEEPLYRFDGNHGKEDFSSDIIAGAKGNHEALARVQDWVRTTFSGQSSAEFVNQANVSSLNPAIQRPDLYVDQLEYPTPLWDSINKGTIDKNTPFVLPKFATSGNLVNDHVEGTEPSTGTFTTTSQTITPSAVSGKVEITREAWDQGGNPQLSTILWRQIVRAYNEALEQAAAALLESLSVTTVTLTAGGTDSQVSSEVKAALADLHFIRGGFRMRDFKLERGLYTKLANAKDADGRPLFPVLAPANADGTMAPFFGALDLAGLAGMPSWALPYVAGAPNDSYLYDREDVHGWASAPQRLEFEYRVAFVDIAVWGYKALACTRTDGVRKMTYDAVP